MKTKTGIELIQEERERQMKEKGWTLEFDQQWINNELPNAAICYLVEPDLRDASAFQFPETWDIKWWKPSPEDRIRELVKAGAMVAAEIDRLQNLEK
jgi:hypothetical protein